jgi:hypothetical protein
MKQFLTILILLSSLAGLGQTPKTISQHVEFTGNLTDVYFIADISPRRPERYPGNDLPITFTQRRNLMRYTLLLAMCTHLHR